MWLYRTTRPVDERRLLVDLAWFEEVDGGSVKGLGEAGDVLKRHVCLGMLAMVPARL